MIPTVWIAMPWRRTGGVSATNSGIDERNLSLFDISAINKLFAAIVY